MDHMEYSIALPPHVEQTNAGAEWTAMKQRHFHHVNPNSTSFHQPSRANLFTSFLISISFDQVQDVFNILGLSVEEALRFNKILKSFEDLCLPRFLIIYNRFRFFMCKQNGPEFNGFLQQLLAWSDLCEFGELKDILLKDSIIRGISEESVRQHLLRTEQLDFNKTVEICKAGLVKQYATENSKTVENEFADAWTDTCNDIVENNNSDDKLQTLDKATGNSVAVAEKETQTDWTLNIGCEGIGIGVAQVQEASETENPITNCVDNNPFYVLNNLTRTPTPSQVQTGCDIIAEQTTIDLVSKRGKDEVEDIIVEKKDVVPMSKVKTLKAGCDSIDVRRSQRKRRKVGEDKQNAEVEINSSVQRDTSTAGDILWARSSTNDELMFSANMSMNENVADDHRQPEQQQQKRTHDDGRIMLTLECEESGAAYSHNKDNVICNQISQPKDSTDSEKKCNICLSSFKTLADLKVHSKSHLNGEDCSFICNTCGVRYANAVRLKLHKCGRIKEHPYKCLDCNKSFRWSASLNRHKRTHSGERPYKCKQEKCNSTFADLTSLQRHAHTHTNSRPYQCTCGVRFADSWALRIHKRIHSGERPHSCNVCGASFARSQHLKDHHKLHTGEKPFECEFCHAKFAEASKLKSHCRKHTGEKPYLCKTCGKSFTWSAAYKRHMKTHTLEKPYICQFCGNAFADNSTLVRHRRLHTGEKPYRCDHCPSTFADSSSLTRHRQIHSKSKDFTCDMCSASFAVKAYLTKHLRTHSGEKPHQCSICSAKFADNSKLNRHKKIHTKTKQDSKQPRKRQQHKEHTPQQQQEQQQHDQQQQLLQSQQQQHHHVQQQEQQLLQSQQHQHHHVQLQQQEQQLLQSQQHQHHLVQQQQQLLQSQPPQHHHAQLHQQNHLNQQFLPTVESDSDKSSFLLWQDTPQVAASSTVTSAMLEVTDTIDPLLLPNTSSDLSSSHHQTVRDDHDMSQYLSSQLLEFGDDVLHHNDPHQHHPDFHEHLHHHTSPEGTINRSTDQSFIEDIPDHVVTSSVLDAILNIKT